MGAIDFDMHCPYVLFLADVQASSKLEPAVCQGVFARIQEVIIELNSELRPPPILNLSISYGDEIAGLFEHARCAYRVADSLREATYPDTAIRFVVVQDKIGKSSEDIRQIGGPVFKQASERILSPKKKNRFCSWDLGRERLDGPLEALVGLSNGLIQRMTDYQRQVWRLLRSGRSQAQIADMFGKHRQSVSRALMEGGGDLVIIAENHIQSLLLKTEIVNRY